MSTVSALRRRKRTDAFAARPTIRLVARNVMRRRGVSEAKQAEVLAVLRGELLDSGIDGEALFEEAYNATDGEFPEPRPARDWAGFLDAVAKFFERMLPIILKLIETIVPLFSVMTTDESSSTAEWVAPSRTGDESSVSGPLYAAAMGGTGSVSAMAYQLVPTYMSAGLDFNAPDFQSLWIGFTERMNGLIERLSDLADTATMAEVMALKAAFAKLVRDFAAENDFAKLLTLTGDVYELLKAIRDCLT